MSKKKESLIRRKKGIRAKVIGTPERPRLSVYKSNRFMYAQIINDKDAKTIVGISQKHLKKEEKMKRNEIAFSLGELIAKMALAKKIKKVVFDRSGYVYHGRVKALADGARKGGLEF